MTKMITKNFVPFYNPFYSSSEYKHFLNLSTLKKKNNYKNRKLLGVVMMISESEYFSYLKYFAFGGIL